MLVFISASQSKWCHNVPCLTFIKTEQTHLAPSLDTAPLHELPINYFRSYSYKTQEQNKHKQQTRKTRLAVKIIKPGIQSWARLIVKYDNIRDSIFVTLFFFVYSGFLWWYGLRKYSCYIIATFLLLFQVYVLMNVTGMISYLLNCPNQTYEGEILDEKRWLQKNKSLGHTFVW